MNSSELIENGPNGPATSALPALIPTPGTPAIPSKPKETSPPAVSAVLGTVDRLSPEEAAEYQACELIIQRGWDAYVETGLALARIRDGQLFREEFVTFDEYCQRRWGLQPTKAQYAITAARIATTLGALPDVPKPDHEAQLRPLFGLAPDQAQVAWQCAVVNSCGRKITEKMVKRAVKELEFLAPTPSVKPQRVSKAEQRKLVNEAMAELLVLIRQQVSYNVLLSKMQALYGLIQTLFVKRKSQ